MYASNTVAVDKRRLIKLEGAVNFRDLGGYYSADGAQVRWGHLYRSDSLAELTGKDVAVLAALQLRTVCDLRHEEERVRKPDHAEAIANLQFRALGFYPSKGRELLERIHAGRIGAAEVEAQLCDAYARLPTEQASIYASILQTLLAPGALPTLIHCTSGKDRTGFAAAVVLMALGVPRATILEDYLLTNRYRRNLAFMVGEQVDPQVMAALTQAHPSYLAAAWETIDRTWGSDEKFLQEALACDTDSRDRLRGLLLESGEGSGAG